MELPEHAIPGGRLAQALRKGTQNDFLFSVGGGIGDQICSEPTVRYACEQFKDCTISVVCYNPELFSHLPLNQLYHYPTDKPQAGLFLKLSCYDTPSDFSNQFLSSLQMHCIDYPSMLSLRLQLPVSYRHIVAKGKCPTDENILRVISLAMPRIYIHAGKGWPSKTFPKLWWDSLIAWLDPIKPILIGETTIDVDASKCFDLRGKLTLAESIYCLQTAHVVFTNDSAPLHMASSHDPDLEGSGTAFIGFVATVKHADYLYHWRFGEFGWRMKDHSRGNVWDTETMNPNRVGKLDLANYVNDGWLPDPQAMAEWALEGIRGL